MKFKSLSFHLAICAGLLVAAIAAQATPAQAQPVYRTCGILPGSGFYSYTKTRGVTCRVADKIAYRAGRRFCAHRHGCRYGLHTSPLHVYRGTVGYHGWRCRVRQGYELNDVRCRRGEMSFHHESAA